MTTAKRNWFNRLPAWSSSRAVRLAWLFIITVSILAIIGPLIANEKPYYCKLEGVPYYPMFSSVTEASLSALHPKYAPVDWLTTSFESVWRPLVPYSHSSIDLKTGSTVSPFDHQPGSLRMRHWLGTDIVGRDVLAGMIRGCRVSLMIGLGSMILALLIGVPLGAMAAYWGNKGKRISYFQFMLSLLFLLIIFELAFIPMNVVVKTGMMILFLFIGLWLIRLVGKNSKKQISIPLDPWVMGAVSIVDGFPAMFLILILVAILPFKGWLVIMVVIALLRWPSMARYMRAEVFKMRETNYVKAAQILNLPTWSILSRHIIPFAFRPIMVSFIFGVSTAILAESSLSYLGIGLPAEQINWGRLLAQSRANFDAWWLVVFPGCAIFFTLISLYTIGNAIQRKISET